MANLDDQIDSDGILNSVADVTYKNGYSFGFGLRIATVFFLIFGVLSGMSFRPIEPWLGQPALWQNFHLDASRAF